MAHMHNFSSSSMGEEVLYNLVITLLSLRCTELYVTSVCQNETRDLKNRDGFFVF